MKRQISEERLKDSVRLRQIMEQWQNQHGLTQTEIARKLGMTQGALWQYANGRVPINLPALLKFAGYFECEPADISPELTDSIKEHLDSPGKLKAIERHFDQEQTDLRVKEKSRKAVPAARPAPRPAPRPTGQDLVTIHSYETSPKITLRDRSGFVGGLIVSRDWIDKHLRGVNSIESVRVLTGFGDSMRPFIAAGDPLLIDTSVKTVEFDSVYFFRVGDEGFIKRLQRIPGQGLTAISENSAYRDWVIDKTMDFEVLGRVIKILRSEDL